MCNSKNCNYEDAYGNCKLTGRAPDDALCMQELEEAQGKDWDDDMYVDDDIETLSIEELKIYVEEARKQKAQKEEK